MNSNQIKNIFIQYFSRSQAGSTAAPSSSCDELWLAGGAASDLPHRSAINGSPLAQMGLHSVLTTVPIHSAFAPRVEGLC
jgi:hypothetical protein